MVLQPPENGHPGPGKGQVAPLIPQRSGQARQLFRFRGGIPILPGDGRHEGPAVFIQGKQPVPLAGNADPCQGVPRLRAAGPQPGQGPGQGLEQGLHIQAAGRNITACHFHFLCSGDLAAGIHYNRLQAGGAGVNG